MRWDNSHGQDHLKAYIRYQEDDNDDGEDDDNDLYIIRGCRYVTKHFIYYQQHIVTETSTLKFKIWAVATSGHVATNCDVPGKSIGIGKNLIPELESDKFNTGKNLETGIGKICYRKKSRNRYRKYLVQEKGIGIV